jgi:hypothetical protein
MGEERNLFFFLSLSSFLPPPPPLFPFPPAPPTGSLAPLPLLLFLFSFLWSMRIMTSGLRGGRLKWRTDAAADDDADADAAHDEAQQARSAIVAVVEGSLIAREYCAPLG